MKIVVLDRPFEQPGELDWSPLEQLGETTFYEHGTSGQAALRIGDAEIVILNKTPIGEAVLDACPNIRFISVIGTGYNVVDVDAARARGIPVANVPNFGSEAIAQHAIALLLEITNRVAHHDAEVRKLRRSAPRDWCFWDYPLIELAGKTMGVVGCGHIGQVTAAVAKALGMRVLVYDPVNHPELEPLYTYVDLDTLYRESHVISLHCPLFPETKHMINRQSIEKMRDGVILINNSRGGLVIEQDLADALRAGKVSAAGLDAVESEPIEADNPLLSAPNVFITPHISWAALECRRRLRDYTIENVRRFLAGHPIHIVNQ